MPRTGTEPRGKQCQPSRPASHPACLSVSPGINRKKQGGQSAEVESSGPGTREREAAQRASDQRRRPERATNCIYSRNRSRFQGEGTSEEVLKLCI